MPGIPLSPPPRLLILRSATIVRFSLIWHGRRVIRKQGLATPRSKSSQTNSPSGAGSWMWHGAQGFLCGSDSNKRQHTPPQADGLEGIEFAWHPTIMLYSNSSNPLPSHLVFPASAAPSLISGSRVETGPPPATEARLQTTRLSFPSWSTAPSGWLYLCPSHQSVLLRGRSEPADRFVAFCSVNRQGVVAADKSSRLA